MKKSKQQTSQSRRNFLRGGAALASVAGLGSLGAIGSEMLAPKMVSAAPIPAHKRLIVLELSGGNDGLNTVIPTGLTRYYDRRPTIGIPASSALSLASGPSSSMYRLHPSMTGSQALWNEGGMAVVNQVGYPNRNLSHFVSQDIWSFGIRGNVGGSTALSGWMARYADLFASTPTGIVSTRAGRPTAFFGGDTAPLMVGSLSGFNFVRDWRNSNDHSYRQSVAKDIAENGIWVGDGERASATAVEQSYQLADQIKGAIDGYSSGVEYPDSNPGRALKEMATLIQAGFDTQIFYTRHGGFDTHSGQLTRHDDLLGRMDSAIAAFAADLKAMNVWDDTVIVVISEFGRRHEENGSAGTDHGHGNCMLLYGGAVSGGMYGPDFTTEDMDMKYGDYKIDFRTIYRDIIENHLGHDASAVLPEAPEIGDSPGGLII